MKANIAVLPGDGIGPEVTEEAVKVLKTIAKIFGHDFIFEKGDVGAQAIEKTGSPYPKKTHLLCLKSDAILFGAVGDPKFDLDPKAKVRPEQGLLQMRKKLGLFANLRPVFSFPPLYSSSPLKNEILKDVDLIFVRELTSGIYFGKPKIKTAKKAIDTCFYSKNEILRISKLAFDLARKRKKKLTLVDKANVLATSQLWRQTVMEISKKYPDVKVDYLYVDAASMKLIQNPADFDVILTDNMFGDILTDEASVIAGSIGLLPSASLGKKYALYEPIHGSFPQAAGKNIANPIGSILSASMLLEFSLKLKKEADLVKEAVFEVLNEGFGTQDLLKENYLTTSELGEKIREKIRKISKKENKFSDLTLPWQN